VAGILHADDGSILWTPSRRTGAAGLALARATRTLVEGDLGRLRRRSLLAFLADAVR